MSNEAELHSITTRGIIHLNCVLLLSEYWVQNSALTTSNEMISQMKIINTIKFSKVFDLRC